MYVVTLDEMKDIPQLLLKDNELKIVPFTIVARNNIVNILLEDREATWRRDLESKGCRIVIETEGIGDFESVQRIAMRHIADQIKPEKTVGIKDNGRKSFFRK